MPIETAIGAYKVLEMASKSEIGKAAAKKFKVRWDILSAKMLRDYYTRTSEFLSRTKTLIHRQQDVALLDIFVAPILQLDTEKLTAKEIWERTNESCRLVINAPAGSGKSMFLKYLFLKFPIENTNKFPVFVSFRSIASGTLMDSITAELSTYSKSFRIDHLRLGLELGIFCLLLDGFDEVDPADRDVVEKELLDIARKYPKTSIIVSGRPDEKFDSWPHFDVLAIANFTKENVLELADKIDQNVQKLDQFKRLVREGLYEKHREFLQNPLLTTMLILVFCEGNSIPDKSHLFYERAYEVLAREHDGLKDLYERRFHSSATPDQLRLLLELFSLITFVKSKYAFEPKDALEFVSQAQKSLNIKGDTSKILKDFSESLSILIKEGRLYHYMHRSFQEYLSAHYLLNRIPDKCPTVLRRVTWSGGNSYLLQLTLQMNRRLVLQTVLLPWVIEFHEKLAKLDPNAEPHKVLRVFFKGAQTEEGDNDTPGEKWVLECHSYDEFNFISAIALNATIRNLYKTGFWMGFSFSSGSSLKRTNITERLVKGEEFLMKTATRMAAAVIELRASIEDELHSIQPRSSSLSDFILSN